MGNKKIVVSKGKEEGLLLAKLFDEDGVCTSASTWGKPSTPQRLVYELFTEFPRNFDTEVIFAYKWLSLSKQELKRRKNNGTRKILLSYHRQPYFWKAEMQDIDISAISSTVDKALLLLFVKYGAQIGVEIVFDEGVPVNLE
jgi:hypothetical protein